MNANIDYLGMSKIFGNSFNPTATHSIEIEVIGTKQVIKVDGVQVLKFNDSTFTEGSVGVRTCRLSAAVLQSQPRGLRHPSEYARHTYRVAREADALEPRHH